MERRTTVPGEGPETGAAASRPAVVRVAAAQLPVPGPGCQEELFCLMDRLVAQAAAGGARLVLFPAMTGLCGSPAKAPLDSCHGGVPEAFAEAAATLAGRYRVYLAPGTIPAPVAGGVANTAHLYAPDGSLAGSQAQTHLLPRERGMGLVPGDELGVFETEVGKVGFLVGTDTWYPEVGRILALMGADIFLAPVAVPAPYSPWRQVAGLWQQVQGNQVFGLEAGLAGVLGGDRFEGRSAAMAPVEITPGETGTLAAAPDPGAEALVVADLDYEALRRVRDDYPIFRHLNPGLYRRYLGGANS